jgi:serine/threonine-protein kinase
MTASTTAIGTTSAMNDDVTPGAVSRHEHVADARRLRAVLAIGVVTWLAVGVPGDLLLAATLPGCDAAALLRVRLAAAIVLGLGLWAVCDERTPSRRWLHTIEVVTFATAAAATGLFVILGAGLASPTTAQLSCILLAQSTALPRRWHEGAPALMTTLLAFVAVVAIGVVVDERLLAQLDDARDSRVLATGLFCALGSLGILVVAGDAAWGLRKSAFFARHIGRYQLKQKIGAGGTGEVWVAWHAGLKRDVALKILRASKDAQRFLESIEATSRLTHPNTVRVLDRGVADGEHWYFAMELVEGKTLRALVEEEGPLAPDRAVRLVLQVAVAIAEAHGLGIVHRDLKPENVLVTSAGRERDLAKVCDFALSSSASFAWAAPEQLYGREAVDARADVWGLGGLLVFALGGRTPRDPGPLGTVPAGIRMVVAGCLAKDKSERYADAAEVVRAMSSL